MKLRMTTLAASAALALACSATAFAQNPNMKSPPFYPSMIQGTPNNTSFAYNHTADHAEFASRGNQSTMQANNNTPHSMVQLGQRNQSSPYSGT